ncbi:MAG: hypothetical protein JSS81_03070 [Acidobacteria bacterium]|nr:hypothetical protein [Acidobacteriota bacterium]
MKTKTAEQIMAIDPESPEKLFSGDAETAKTEFYELSRDWHPDRNPAPQATVVFQRVTALYRKTLELLETQRWPGPGVLDLPAGRFGTAAVTRRINYFKCHSFELGELYVAKTEIAFAVEHRFADLFENAKRQLAGFRFAGKKMQREIGRYLPREPEFFASARRLFLLLPKPAEMVLLADLLDFMGGALDPRHVGWIGNRLYNLACYLDYAGIIHHDIGPRTVFVSPVNHGAMLLGGWWYARPRGRKIKALPPRTVEFAPPDAIAAGRADGRTDLEAIRRTGCELLGAKSGWALKSNPKIPAAMARWLNGATSGAAVTDYELWQNVLELDFGAPRFVRLDAGADAIYGR